MVAASWRGIQARVGFFHLQLLLVVGGIVGVFLAMDLFLFYFFWELMLIPINFLIVLWGHEHRQYATVKFFIFTQLGSLLMLVAMLGLYLLHGQKTGTYPFDYFELLGTQLSPEIPSLRPMAATALAGLALLVVALGVYPSPLIDLIRSFAGG